MIPRHMKSIISFAAALTVACSICHAQMPVVERDDPNPSSDLAWEGMKDIRFGWGSVDSRYKKDEVPVLSKSMVLRGWRGERVFAQAVLATPVDVESFRVVASDFKSGKNVIPSSAVSKYFVTYVIGEHVFQGDPVLSPDRLACQDEFKVASRTVRPVWLDIRIPADAVPGKYKGTVTADCDGKVLQVPCVLEVGKRVLPEPSDWSFHLDLWQNPYAVARYFNVPLWSEEHFAKMRPIMEYLASCGEKVITASIFQHPWNSQTEDPFESMIGKFKGIDGSWKYDYTVFDRWVEFMMSCGITEQIDCYSILPWHLTFEYFDAALNCTRSEKMDPGSREYEEYQLPFLTDFARHLREKGWFEKTCIAMDERPKDLLEHAYAIVHKADKDYRIEGAVNYYGPEVAERMYDISFAFREPLLTEQQLSSHHAKGNKVTFYTCCNPQRPNTFLDSPTAESVFLGWYAAAAGYDGYLRWAYNSWVKEPCVDGRFRTWRAGDCYLVYPDGPSIRSERLLEGIQDFEKIRIIREEGDPRKVALIDAQLSKFRDIDWDTFEDARTIALINESKALLRSL